MAYKGRTYLFVVDELEVKELYREIREVWACLKAKASRRQVCLSNLQIPKPPQQNASNAKMPKPAPALAPSPWPFFSSSPATEEGGEVVQREVQEGEKA